MYREVIDASGNFAWASGVSGGSAGGFRYRCADGREESPVSSTCDGDVVVFGAAEKFVGVWREVETGYWAVVVDEVAKAAIFGILRAGLRWD